MSANPQKHRKGFSRVWHATGYSIAGLRAAWHEAAFRQEVIIAAGLVYWLGSAWPDIIVAAAIAFLFLHSALEIIRHARSDMKTQQIA